MYLQQRPIVSLNSINWLLYKMNWHCVYCDAGAEYLIDSTISRFKWLNYNREKSLSKEFVLSYVLGV